MVLCKSSDIQDSNEHVKLGYLKKIIITYFSLQRVDLYTMHTHTYIQTDKQTHKNK